MTGLDMIDVICFAESRFNNFMICRAEAAKKIIFILFYIGIRKKIIVCYIAGISGSSIALLRILGFRNRCGCRRRGSGCIPLVFQLMVMNQSQYKYND